MNDNNTPQSAAYSFPIEQTLSVQYLRQRFWLCAYTSAPQPLHYRVALPDNVQPVSLQPQFIKALEMTVIGEYTRIDGGPYIEAAVACAFSKYEMNASDWLYKKLELMGETILHCREAEGGATGRYADALCLKRMPGGEELVSRYTALKDYDRQKGGANYVCVKASCLAGDYESLSLSLLHVVSSWDFSNKSGWAMAEALKPFDTDFRGRVQCYIPYSWNARFDVQNDEQAARFIFEHSIDDENKGLINAFFYPCEDFATGREVLEKLLSRFPGSGPLSYKLGELAAAENTNPFVAAIWRTEGQVDFPEENLSAYCEIVILGTEKCWHCFELIGPKKSLQAYYWEINRRCLQIIIDSFQNLAMERKSPALKASRAAPAEPGAAVFRTFKGKTYTKESWEKFEEEQWKKKTKDRT